MKIPILPVVVTLCGPAYTLPHHRHQAKQHLPPGIDLIKADDFREWQVDIRVLDDNPLYKNQIYRLRFQFGDGYPIRTFRINPVERPWLPCISGLPITFFFSPIWGRIADNLKRGTRGDFPSDPGSCHNIFASSYAGAAAAIARYDHGSHHSYRYSGNPGSNRPSSSHPSAHLLQRHYLSRPPRQCGLVAGSKRRECLHEHSEHVDWEHQE